MGVNRHTDSGIGEYTEAPPAPRTCCKCGGPWDLPAPVKNNGEHARYGRQRFIYIPGGDGLCWDCFDEVKT